MLRWIFFVMYVFDDSMDSQNLGSCWSILHLDVVAIEKGRIHWLHLYWGVRAS